MYSIVQVIYGTYVPHNSHIQSEIPRLLDEDGRECCPDGWMDDEEPFTTHYHGGSEYPPCWVGVTLCEFDEATDAIKVSDLRLTPTDEQRYQTQQLMDQLPQSIRDILPPVDVYFVFCSS